MALSVGNLLDTGCEKHRIQCDLSHLFYPLKPDLHRIKINNKNRCFFQTHDRPFGPTTDP